MADNNTEKQRVQELTDKLEQGLQDLFNSDSFLMLERIVEHDKDRMLADGSKGRVSVKEKLAEMKQKISDQKMPEKPKEVLVRNGNRTRSVSADDIYYIESSNRKVTLYLRHEKIEYYDKISSLESELKPDFFRIHKGYLVNIKYVERYDRTEVKMRNGDSLLISKYKYQDFVKRYLEYILEER